MASSAPSEPNTEPTGADLDVPVAVVGGKPLTQLPLDLYIPPDALAILLSEFEGPLDLLLYLIRKQNLDILAIPVAEVTRQYLDYLAMMQSLKIELAAEYLLMAAWLAEIKTRMMLPPTPNEDGEDEDLDPRALLVERLLAYERLKHAAEWLDEQPRSGRDFFPLSLTVELPPAPREHEEVSLAELVRAMRQLARQGELVAAHEVRAEPLSIRARMSDILARLQEVGRIELTRLLRPEEGRMGVAVSLVAVLELARSGLIDWSQDAPFEPVELMYE